MTPYILCIDSNGTWEPRGIYASEAEARATSLSGDFLLIPIQPGISFDSTIIDEGTTGAILFSLISSNTTIQDLSDRLGTVETKQGQIIAAAQNFNDRLTEMEDRQDLIIERVLTAEDNILTLHGRVTVLEEA